MTTQTVCERCGGTEFDEGSPWCAKCGWNKNFPWTDKGEKSHKDYAGPKKKSQSHVDLLKGHQVKARALRAEAALAGDESAPLYEGTDHGWVTGKLEIEDVPMGYRRYAVGDYDVEPETVEPVGRKTAGPAQRIKGERYIREVRPEGKPRSWQLWEHDGEKYKRVGTARNHEEKHRFLYPNASDDEIQKHVKFDEDDEAKWVKRKLGYGEVTAPEVVDTLREADCPVCGNSESFDGEQCKQCGFKKPPDQYMDPDLDKAKEVDLRGGEEDPTAVGDDIASPADDLICENCGTTYASGAVEGEGAPGGVKKVKTIPELPKPDDPDEDAPTPGPADGKVEGDSVPPTSTENLQAGDLCPNCGKGKLVPNDAAGATDTAGDTAEGVFIPPEEVEDEPPEPAEKKAASQKDQSMRPVLAAVADQQKVIEDQAQVIAALIQRTSVLEAQVGTVARLAGVEKELITAGRHAVAKLRSTATKKTADVNNPAQPVPAPSSEGPAETTEQTLAPAGRDDVQSIGASPVADVQPDAQTSVDTPDTVLNEPLNLNEESVTAPVAGTEGPLPLDKVKIETDVRVGNPDDPNPAFPLEGPFAQRATTTGAKSESRAFASLRLARLRLALGISPDSGISPEGDDLMLGQEISESDMSDELLAHEIGTLSKIVNQARATQRQAPRNLVPRSAAAGGQRPPSLRSEAAGEIPQPVPSMAPGVTDEEILFE